MSNQKNPKVGVVIVGYNSSADIADCVGSLLDQSYTNYTIYFVDSASSDDTLAILTTYLKVVVLAQGENVGFARGNNIGIAQAVKDGAEYLLLVNPDTISDKELLRNLVKQADVKTILQPMILIYKDGKTDQINTTGSYLNFLGFSYCDDYKKPRTAITNSKAAAGASGAALFVSKVIGQQIGWLDERYFMYYEDLDFSWRARQSGYSVKMIPQAVIWHKYSFSKNKQKFFYAERNRLFFLYKNFSFKYLALILPALLLNELAMLVYSVVGGWSVLKVRSYTSFFKLVVSTKREISQKVGERQLKGLIGSAISFGEIKSPLFYPYNLFLGLYWGLIKGLI